MEIYNEKVRDLLQLSSGKDLQRKGDQLHSLKLREHPRDGPYVQGEQHIDCPNASHYHVL